MRRRTTLAVLAGFLGMASGGYIWRRHARRLTRQKAQMRRDFTEGHIYISDGWYLSAYEVELLQIDPARRLTR